MKSVPGLLALILSTSFLSAAGTGGSQTRPVTPKLPPAEVAVPVEKRNVIEVGMNRRLAFEGTQVTERELVQKIKGRVALDKNVKLHVSGHPWNMELTKAVIELCQKKGAWNISFATAEG